MKEQQEWQRRWQQLGGRLGEGIRFADGPMSVLLSAGHGSEKRIDKAAISINELYMTDPLGGGMRQIVELNVRDPGGILRKPTETSFDLDQYQILRQGRRMFVFIPKDDAPTRILAVAFEVTTEAYVKTLRTLAGRRVAIEELA